MPDLKNKLPNCFKIAFTFENIVCRIIAAWCIFSAVTLMGDGDFQELSFAQNISLASLLLAVVLIFAVLSAVRVFTSGFESDSWFLILASGWCVVSWLTDYSDADSKFHFVLAVSVAFCLFLLYFIRKNSNLWESWKPGEKTVWASSVVFAVICCFVISLFTCLRYLTFTSPNFDFGLFVNMFHHMKETGLPLCTSERDVLMSHFAVHLSPIYYLILPFYMIFPSPLTLQIAQAVLVASCVFPVVLLAKHFGISNKLTIACAFLTAFYPILMNGCMYDIHENCFLAPLLLWVFYFYETRRFPLMYLFAVLTLFVKEDAAVYIVIFAVFVMFSRRNILHGAVLGILAVVYFSAAMKILDASAAYYAELYADATPNPAIAGPMQYRFENLIANEEDGLLGAVKTALFNPGYLLTQLFTTADEGWGKLIYFFQLFLPLGFLPFLTLKPSRWLLLAPILINLLTNYKYQYDIVYQYHFGISAFLIYAAVGNLAELKLPKKRYFAGFSAALCCCFCVITVLPKTASYIENYKNNGDVYREMEVILDEIPGDASVCASSSLVAHLADRDEIYALNFHGNEPDVDYVVFDARYQIDEKSFSAYADHGYEVIAEYEDMLLIMKKNA